MVRRYTPRPSTGNKRRKAPLVWSWTPCLDLCNTLVFDPAAKIFHQSKADYLTYGSLLMAAVQLGAHTSPLCGSIGALATSATAWIFSQKHVDPLAQYKEKPSIGKTCRRVLLNLGCASAMTAAGLGMVAGFQDYKLAHSPEALHAKGLLTSGVELKQGGSVRDSLDLKQTAFEHLHIQTRGQLPWHKRFFTSYGTISYDVPTPYTDMVTGQKHESYRAKTGFSYRDVEIKKTQGPDEIIAMQFQAPMPESRVTSINLERRQATL